MFDLTSRKKIGLRDRLDHFIRKNGYSFKAYFLALFLFPPAAVFIALKMHQLGLLSRFAAASFVMLFHASIILGGGALILDIVGS